MAVNRKMPRPQEIIFPYLRPEMPDVTFTSWVPDVHYRTYPLVNIRRLSGRPFRGASPNELDRPVLEISAYSRDGIVGTEDILLDARYLIYSMWRDQIVTQAGSLFSYYETLGPRQFDSPYDDTWRIQYLAQVGTRPRRE